MREDEGPYHLDGAVLGLDEADATELRTRARHHTTRQRACKSNHMACQSTAPLYFFTPIFIYYSLSIKLL
jgi:hypothetical protein